MIKAAGAKFRMVGLSATPGTDIKAIQSIIDTLSICQIEAKTEDDPDVKQYIYHREEEVIIVKPPDAVTRIDKEIDKFIQPYMQHLRNKNVSSTIHQDKIKAFTVRLAHAQHLGRSNNDRRLDVYFHAVREMLSIKEKLHTHGILIARNKLQELRLYPKPYLGNWMKGDKFQTLLNEVSKATHTTQEDEEEAQEDLLRNNPKFEKLTEVLIGERMYAKYPCKILRILQFLIDSR
jgi:Fanconi anemia group M protein